MGSVHTDSRQNALPTYLSPGRAAKRKKMKIGGTYLLQGPFGPNKTNLPTYLGGASQLGQTPYPGRSRNPGRYLDLLCVYIKNTHSPLTTHQKESSLMIPQFSVARLPPRAPRHRAPTTHAHRSQVTPASPATLGFGVEWSGLGRWLRPRALRLSLGSSSSAPPSARWPRARTCGRRP